MARTKCDAAQSATKAQRNGTANASSAEACTVQKMLTCTMFGSTGSNLSQRTGDWYSGRANGREQAADCTHQRGKDETAGHQRRGDAELERDLAETGKIRRPGRQPVHRQRQHTPDQAAD